MAKKIACKDLGTRGRHPNDPTGEIFGDSHWPQPQPHERGTSMKYLLLDVTTEETKLLLIATLHAVQLHGRIAMANGRKVLAPPLEGRSFSKLEKLPLQFLYWNTFREAPSEDYAKLLKDCVARFELLPVDATPIRELEAQVAQLYPDEVGVNPKDRAVSKGSAKAEGGNPSAPKSGSTTRRVWEIADALWTPPGPMPDRKKVMAACEAQGINPSTASTQYGKWKASRLSSKGA